MYSPNIFAKSFLKVLKNTPSKKYDIVIANFIKTLKKYGAIKDTPKILKSIRKINAEDKNINLIEIETARGLDAKSINAIKKMFKKNDEFSEKINPEIIAGVKIIINNEFVLDGSLRRKLKNLF